MANPDESIQLIRNTRHNSTIERIQFQFLVTLFHLIAAHLKRKGTEINFR